MVQEMMVNGMRAWFYNTMPLKVGKNSLNFKSAQKIFFLFMNDNYMDKVKREGEVVRIHGNLFGSDSKEKNLVQP